ncbi:MAG: tol-pal system-associated acyl-CoA thioesterase [Pseudomonadota bacterium]
MSEEWQLEIRIYFEDTDFSGVVYHANYLKYFERGRTEALRTTGLNHHDLLEKEQLVFTLRHIDVTYHRPAKIDDVLTIKTIISEIRGARLIFSQKAYREKDLLAEAIVTVACMTLEGRPQRLPKDMREEF